MTNFTRVNPCSPRVDLWTPQKGQKFKVAVWSISIKVKFLVYYYSGLLLLQLFD